MENVTEELVRQNGNQAAAVMADYAGQGGGGGGSSLETITPKIVEFDDSVVAVLQEMPEAGKAYNVPYPAKGMMVPVFIVSIGSEEEEGEVYYNGVCLFMGYTGSSNYNIEISFDDGYTSNPTLLLEPIPEELQSELGGTTFASIGQAQV